MNVAIPDVDALLDRHRDRFRALLEEIVAEEQGEDPFTYPLDRFRGLDDGAKLALVERASIIARTRVERELERRAAAWLVIVGDDVVRSSADVSELPSPEEVLSLGEPVNRVAYLFEAPLIEEGPDCRSTWAPLGGLAHYPTLPLAIGSGAAMTNVVADLDTGSHATLVDAAKLEAPSATWFRGRHLGATYFWSPALAQLSLQSERGGVVRRAMPIRRVARWTASPFVRLNPNRSLLAGRDLLRAFSLAVVLRSREGETTIETAE